MTDDRVRVLVAEDDEDIRHLLQRVLTLADVDVHTAGDGEQALAALEQQPVHCLVLDVRMPVLDGLEVLRALRARHLGVPVVLLTASVEGGVRREALDLGAAAVLSKPFDGRDLLGAVAQAVHAQHPDVALSHSLTTALSGR